MLVGDALAMPVHWYYDVPAIKKDFKGWITKYEKPKNLHPSSVLRVSNTGRCYLLLYITASIQGKQEAQNLH